MDDPIQLFSIATNHECLIRQFSFLFSCQWASLARQFGHSSGPTADYASLACILSNPWPTAFPTGRNGWSTQNADAGLRIPHRRESTQQVIETLKRGRALPSLDTFLKPPCFDTLHHAACHGPLITINHSEWRSDILILLYNFPPCFLHPKQSCIYGGIPHPFFAHSHWVQSDQTWALRDISLEG